MSLQSEQTALTILQAQLDQLKAGPVRRKNQAKIDKLEKAIERIEINILELQGK